MVGVEHGFTRMARIGTDKKSVGIRRIRVICVPLCGFYTFSYQTRRSQSYYFSVFFAPPRQYFSSKTKLFYSPRLNLPPHQHCFIRDVQVGDGACGAVVQEHGVSLMHAALGTKGIYRKP